MNVNTQYIPKTEAVLEIMQRTGVGRFVVDRQIKKMEDAGLISFVDNPRDFRQKIISREHVEAIVQALSPDLYP